MTSSVKGVKNGTLVNGGLSNGTLGDYGPDAKKAYGQQVVLGEESDSENSSAYHEPYKLLHKKTDYFGLLKKDAASKSADTGEQKGGTMYGASLIFLPWSAWHNLRPDCRTNDKVLGLDRLVRRRAVLNASPAEPARRPSAHVALRLAATLHAA